MSTGPDNREHTEQHHRAVGVVPAGVAPTPGAAQRDLHGEHAVRRRRALGLAPLPGHAHRAQRGGRAAAQRQGLQEGMSPSHLRSFMLNLIYNNLLRTVGLYLALSYVTTPGFLPSASSPTQLPFLDIACFIPIKLFLLIV